MSFIKQLETLLGLSPATIENLINSLIVVVILLAIRFIAVRMVYRQTQDVTRQYYWRKGITYVVTFLALFIIGRTWFQGIQSIATFFGLLAAGLAIALQDTIVNLAAWLFILWRRPFDVGDRIEIGGHAGDVIDQRLFMFSLMEIGNWVEADQSTGRVIHIPNGTIFKKPLANYHKGFKYIWHEIPVLLTFESNWVKAKKILQKISDEHSPRLSADAEKKLRRAAKKYMIFYSRLTPKVWTTVRDSGVLLTIRYLCDPRNRRGSEEEIWEDILHAFEAHGDIDFAYPTTRFFVNKTEGKEALRALPVKPGRAVKAPSDSGG